MTKAKLPPGVRIRPDGRYEQRITLDGKRTSVYAKSAKELKGNVERARNEHAQGIVARTNETVASYLTRWLAEVIAPPHRAWRTYTMRRGHIEHHLIPALGSIRLARLTTMDVRQMLNAIHRAGYAARTVNHIRSTLTAALNDALREGDVPRNAAALVKPLPVADDTRQPLTADEARRFLSAMRDDRLGALYALGLVCGLRMGEATGLTWDALDVATGELSVTRALQWQTGGFVLKSPKNRASERQLVMPHAVRDLLRAHRNRQRREQEAMVGWGNDWHLVFTSRTGKPLHETTVNTLLTRHLADAELPRVTFHMLRHSAISLLMARGASAVDVAKVMGHASPDITLKVYAHSFPDGRQRVANLMDDLLDNDPQS